MIVDYNPRPVFSILSHVVVIEFVYK
jgi:hypothetical protein